VKQKEERKGEGRGEERRGKGKTVSSKRQVVSGEVLSSCVLFMKQKIKGKERGGETVK
jgi:hypothetical protein